MDGDAAASTQRGTALTYVTVAGSLALAAALFVAHVFFDSELALAQAADSLSDCLGGLVLAWAVRTSAAPADDEHPHGHASAEPVAALVVAVLVGTLAVEVFRNAAATLWSGEGAALDAPVALVFAAKVLFKGAVALLATRALRTRANPALDALRLDARNDVLVGLCSLAGFGLSRWGLPAVDPTLALLLALYVGMSGLRLARENTTLLMGSSAPRDRLDALDARARSVAGVARVARVIATYHGASLHAYVEVAVAPSLSLEAAHAIGHEVEAVLVEDEDVSRAVVHVEPDRADPSMGVDRPSPEGRGAR